MLGMSSAHGDLIVPHDCAQLIFNLAPLSFISSIVALCNGHTDIWIVPFSVGCTTLLFWTKPTYGWRRNTDITISFLALMYQLYRIHVNNYHLSGYYICKALAVLSYFTGHYYFARNRLWLSMYCHAGIHVFGNIGNVILYITFPSASSPASVH